MLSQEQTFDGRDEWRLLVDELSLLLGMTDTCNGSQSKTVGLAISANFGSH